MWYLDPFWTPFWEVSHDLSMCVNGWESEDPFSVNSYESEYPKNDESGNIYESGKISSSVNLV